MSSSVLYDQLLPTLGARILPALFRRLKKVANEAGGHVLELVAGAIASIGGEEASRLAVELLGDPSPFLQRSAMKLLALQPIASCLDRLWEIHCEMIGNKERLHPNEPKWTLYQESFAALLACVRLDPTWLSRVIRAATPAQPVHDLAHLLSNLEGHEAIWLDCKLLLFEKIDSSHERSLAANIFRHRDAAEIPWLVARVNRNDNLLGPWALRALCRIDPDKAVTELPRLPRSFWGSTSRWCFAEILRHRPTETRACLRRMLQDPNFISIATVYQDNPTAMDIDTLDLLLDHFLTIVMQEARRSPELPSSSQEFSVLCQLLSRVNRLEQLERFERRRGSLLEGWLTDWLMRRGPIPDHFTRPDQEDVFRILEKIGGDGYTRVRNRYINSTKFNARIMAIREAARRPDWETISHLICISQKDEVHGNAGPIEQSYAAFALAAVGRYRDAIETVVRWGLRSLPSVLDQLCDSPIEDEFLDPAFTAVQDGGENLPGGILVLGTARNSKRKSELTDRIRSVLGSAGQESEAAWACIIALRLLGDHSD
jgi:hypothetical protein